MTLTWKKSGYGKYELTRGDEPEVLGRITVIRERAAFRYVASMGEKTSSALKTFGAAKEWVEYEIEGVTRRPEVGAIRE